MCKRKNIIMKLLSIIVLLSIIMLNSCSIEEKDFDFIVLHKNKAVAFLNMHESEITKRLGEPISTKHIRDEETITEYQYDGLSIICENSKVINIKLSNSRYRTIGGISIGSKQLYIFGYYIFTNGTRISNLYATLSNEIDNESKESKNVIIINSRDNLGKNKYLSGEVSEESEMIYSAFISFEETEISSIELKLNNYVYVDF